MQEELDIVRKRFGKDKYAKFHAIVLDELTEDTIRMHMRVREDMSNWFGRLHGGAI
jgi:acyl-coenzyme A thioesterase PaaI-like protein